MYNTKIRKWYCMKKRMYIINFIRGFCMALADSVPGVSGGTIAFILGFYDQFITSLDKIISGTKEERKSAIFFLFKLGIGWIAGMGLAVFILASIFDKRIYEISSLFIGFIIFAIPIIVLEEKKCIKGHSISSLFTLLGIAIVVAITYFNPVSGSENEVDISKLSIRLALYVFVAGMIAISAMVLPGISGSTLLLIFGLYTQIISGVKEVLTFNFSYLPILCIFGVGVLVGIFSVIRFIRIALEKFRPQMIYLIIGLMVGSLYAIVMGPTTLDIPKAPMDMKSFHIPFFVIGGVVIVSLQKLKAVFEKE